MKKIIQFTVTKDRRVYTVDGVKVLVVADGRHYRLSAAERAAVNQGIDAADMGHFAPEDEMEEFYRLHRGN